MKLLLAVALVTWALVASHHIPEHEIATPLFRVGYTHLYEGTINMTSGIPGLSPQVAKHVMKFDILIHALSEREYLLKIENPKVSEGLYAIDNEDLPVSLKSDSELQRELAKTVKFTYVDGRVTSYTLEPEESIYSKNIKRSILRSLELTVKESILKKLYPDTTENENLWPITYNTTRRTPFGEYVSHYVITSSPYTELPSEMSVFNVSRTDNYERIPYSNLHYHHNYMQQGCPEVCRMRWNKMAENKYGAGCPCGHEPHRGFMQLSLTQHCHMKLVEGRMIPEIFHSEEEHVASLYDQDMVVAIRSYFHMKDITKKSISEPKGQTYTDLHDVKFELNEREQSEVGEKISYLSSKSCGVKSPDEVIRSAKILLEAIAKTVIKGDLEDKESQIVGEKIVLLQKALTLLEVQHFEQFFHEIVNVQRLRQADEFEKVKRQIFMDVLPLVGTPECVEFLKTIIKNNLVAPWEAKEMLEALADNIMYPSEKIIRDLRELLEIPQVTRYHIVHSAAHLCVAKVIQRLCISKRQEVPRMDLSSSLEDIESKPSLFSRSSFMPSLLRDDGLREERDVTQWTNKCPKSLATEYVQEITRKLKATTKMQEKVLYIETLARTGIWEALPILTPYAYGLAKDVEEYAPADIDYMKTIAIYSLHNLVSYYPEEILHIVTPEYFNKTEVAKVRIAAFSVILRAQPPMHLLQHIAVDSWLEPSLEVGSFVYSSLEAFGNSSMPCYQLTAERIQKVISQTKRFDLGYHKAKNVLFTYFDDLREFGIEKRFSFVPSNESFIPSSIYTSIGYNTDSLKDVLIQLAMNVQGVTEEDLLKYIDLDILGIHTPKDIPRSKEESIFSKVNLLPRLPKELRFTVYRKMFYTSSYYYFDAQTIRQDLEPLVEYVKLMFTKSRSQIEGHWVELYLPSSYRTLSMGKTLAYPIEFEMKHPLLWSIKVEAKEAFRQGHIHFYVRPSVYYASLYTNHIKNLKECTVYGTYHEHKFTAVYPFEIKLNLKNLHEFEITYKLPEMPKKVCRLQSEAGTFAGKESLLKMPSHIRREPITTIPIPFKTEKVLAVMGLPPVQAEFYTEDIVNHRGEWEHPRTTEEALHQVIKTLRNVGWTRKSYNFTVTTLGRVWPADNEMTMKFYYKKRYENPSAPRMQNEWHQQSEGIQERDIEHESMLQAETPEMIRSWVSRDDEVIRTAADAKKLYHKIRTELPHVAHLLEVRMDCKSVQNKAYLRMEYNHTYDKAVHTFVALANAESTFLRRPLEWNVCHAMKFINRPNEFEYNARKYGKQRAYFYNGITFARREVFSEPDVYTIGKFSYNPVENQIGHELAYEPEKEYFLPETHEECLQDVKEGKPLTIACIRAIREQAIYNKMELTTKWKREIPTVLRNVTYKLEDAIKHIYYHKLDIDRLNVNNEENTIDVVVEYINKFTDEPVVDIFVSKPKENLVFSRLNSKYVEPVSSIHSVFNTYVRRFTNNTLLPTCAMMEKYVRTFDMKTYELPENQCKYVVAAHCTPKKKFAVLAKVLSASAKEVYIYVGEHEIILYPSSRDSYKVKYDGREYTLTTERPVLLDREQQIHAFVHRLAEGSSSSKRGILEFHAYLAGVKVIYDTKNVKVQVDPMYKGELCGLCSEYDGEVTREFRGVDQCIYIDGQDFAKSSIVDAETCGVDKTPKYDVLCPDTQSFHRRRNDDENGHAPTLRRNVIRSRNEFTCFSTRPVPVCDENTEPLATESMSVDFHCLPKRDATAKRLLVEAKRRILGELATKSIDFTETIEVAKAC